MARYEVIAYNDGPILGFAIAGKDRKFPPAKAEWSNPGDRSLIVLSSPLGAEPVYFRHRWGRNPQANLKAEDVKRRRKEAETILKEHTSAATGKATHNSTQ